MRFIYRNTLTGAEFQSNCEITAPNLIKLGADAPIISEPADVESEAKTEPKAEAKPKAKAPAKPKATKTSAKKPVKKGVKK